MEAGTVLITTVEYDMLKAIERATSNGKQIRKFEPYRHYGGCGNDFVYWLVSDNEVLQEMSKTLDATNEAVTFAQREQSKISDQLITIKKKWWYKLFAK